MSPECLLTYILDNFYLMRTTCNHFNRIVRAICYGQWALRMTSIPSSIDDEKEMSTETQWIQLNICCYLNKCHSHKNRYGYPWQRQLPIDLFCISLTARKKSNISSWKTIESASFVYIYGLEPSLCLCVCVWAVSRISPKSYSAYFASGFFSHFIFLLRFKLATILICFFFVFSFL